MTLRLERVVTSGTFSLDGGTWDVDNNVWLLGDDDEVLVIDAAHDAEAIGRAVGDRRLAAVVCTHAHDDHVSAARPLAAATGAPVLLHPAGERLWRLTYPDWRWSRDLADGDMLTVGGDEVHILHTPGHSPAPSASTSRRWAPSSPATPCSRAGPARRGGPSAIARPSSPRSAIGCSAWTTPPSSTPATARTRRSAPSATAWTRHQTRVEPRRRGL